MNGNNSIRFASSKPVLLATLATAVGLMAGCANMTTSSVFSAPVTAAATFGGRLHGGNQPIAGATVTLYYAGQNGPGSGDPTAAPDLGNPIVAATTQTASDGTGSFSFLKSATNGQATSGNTFSCPASGDPIVYVVTRGGNTLNTGDSTISNAAAAFIGMYGPCSTISNASFVDLTEVTTVATMAAIQQYFNPVTESIGADGIGSAKLALINTIGTISNLANVSNGTAVTSTQLSGAGGVSVTVTPETAKINELANIISACINTTSATSTACSNLFTYAVPPDTAVTDRPYHTPAFPTATDTLQALYYIFTNPTNGGSSNLQALYNLAPVLGAPYQPSLTSQPTDWTIAINYSSTSTCGANNGNFVYMPQDINIDFSGNLWIANGQAANGNLTEISPTGTPLTCVSMGGAANGGAVIDTAGNVWYASNNSNNIYRYTPGTQSVLTFPTVVPPLAIFADGGASSTDTVGNIYFTTATGTSLYQIPHGASVTAAVTPIQISSVVGSNPIRIMVDNNHAVWVTSGASVISQVVPDTNVTDPNYLNGFATYQFGVPGNTYGVSVTPDAGLFVSSGGSSGGVTYLTGSGTSYSSSWISSPGQAGLNSPTAIAVDGRDNIWAANNVADTGTGLDALSEISVLQASLTPDGTTTGGLQLASNFLLGGRAIVIDQSGNVWVSGDGTTGSPSNFVTEIVGAASPVYQPYSLGLSSGRFQTIP